MRRALPLLAMLVGTMMATHSLTASAAEYPLPPDNSRLIGENTTYVVPNDGQPLEAVAAKYQIEFCSSTSCSAVGQRKLLRYDHVYP